MPDVDQSPLVEALGGTVPDNLRLVNETWNGPQYGPLSLRYTYTDAERTEHTGYFISSPIDQIKTGTLVEKIREVWRMQQKTIAHHLKKGNGGTCPDHAISK